MIRSPKNTRWGERYAPVWIPWRARIAAIIRVVDDLPLLPTTWIESKRSCGLSNTVISRRIRSSPNRIPNSSRSRT